MYRSLRVWLEKDPLGKYWTKQILNNSSMCSLIVSYLACVDTRVQIFFLIFKREYRHILSSRPLYSAHFTLHSAVKCQIAGVGE